jgi:hypothetical protein
MRRYSTCAPDRWGRSPTLHQKSPGDVHGRVGADIHRIAFVDDVFLAIRRPDLHVFLAAAPSGVHLDDEGPARRNVGLDGVGPERHVIRSDDPHDGRLRVILEAKRWQVLQSSAVDL